MLTKLVIIGLLCNILCPLPNAEANKETTNSTFINQKRPCADQIEWIKNTTLAAKKQFAEYYAQLAKNRVYEKNLDDLNLQLDKIHQLITDSLEKYTVELDKVLAVTANATNQLKVCTEELEKYRITSQNLSSLMLSIRPQVIDLTKKLGLSHDTVDGLDRSLGRMVMFTTDIGNHTVEHTFIKKGGKTIIDKLEEGEIVGQNEEPATGMVGNQGSAPEGVPNPITEAAYDEYEEEDKAFEDLINSDEDIEKADKELLEREQQAELAERQRLADAEKYREMREEQIRLQQIKTNEIVKSAYDLKIVE